MNPLKKSISVILPNFNGEHLLKKFLPSIFEALQYSQIEFEFIIVDDKSTDNSIIFLKKNYPDIILIENSLNKGFSYSCNRGIAIATKELIFLVNSDVKLTLNYFENQFSFFQNKNTFGVMGQIKNLNNLKTEDYARYPRFKGVKLKATTFYFSKNYDDSIYTTYLSGANALICAKKLQFLKGFDEIYSPFYFEDFDMGLRAWKMGWALFYDHQSICYHEVSATTKTINKSNLVKKTYYRNSFILHAIHLNGIRKILWYSQLFTSTLFWHLIKGEFWILYSLIDFIKYNKKILQSSLQIKLMQKKMKSTLEVQDILTIFKNSLKNKPINWV